MALSNSGFGVAPLGEGRNDEGELTRHLSNADLHHIALDVSRKTPASYAQVSESLARMQRMNMSLNQMTRAFSSMTNAGVSFAEATNAFSRAFASVGATMQAQAIKSTVEAQAVSINRLMQEFNLTMIDVLRESHSESAHNPRHSPVYFRYDVTTGEDIRIRALMKFILSQGMTFALAQQRIESKVDAFAHRFNVLAHCDNVCCRQHDHDYHKELEYNYEFLISRIPVNASNPSWEEALNGLDKVVTAELVQAPVVKKRRRFLDL